MQIEHLKITGVTGCPDISVPFGPGFNVILGGNGTGKSLCLWAVRTTILGPQESEKKTPEEGATMVVLTEGSDRVTVVRDLSTGEAEITHQTSKGTAQVIFRGPGFGDAYEDTLNRIVGWSALERWLQFCFVPEGGLGDVSKLVGAKSPVESGKRILAELTETQANLVGDNNGHAGELDVIQEDLASKLNALAVWEDSAGELESLQNQLNEINRKVSESNQGADARIDSYRNLIRLRELLEERDDFKEELRFLTAERDEVKELVERVTAEEKALEDEYGQFLNAGTDLEDALQQWSDSTTKLHDVQRRLHLAKQSIAGKTKGNFIKSAVIMVGSLGILGYFAALGAGIGHIANWLGIGLGGLGFVTVYLKHYASISAVKKRKDEIELLEEENRQVESRIEESKKTMGTLGDLGHPMAIRRAVIQYWKAREDVERIRVKRDAHRPLIELMDTHNEKSDAIQEVEAKIRELKAKAPYLTDFDKQSRTLNGEIDMAKAQSEASNSRADRFGDEKAKIVTEMERICEDAPPLGRLERERKELARRKERVESEAYSLAICVDVWQGALDEYRRRSQEQMASVTAKYFTEFTQGDYQDVRPNAKGLEVQDAKGSWSSTDTLSDGSLEQLGMAMRLAEASVNPGSLVLDNVFLKWDETRCKNARLALQSQVDSGGQVLLFTHNSQYAQWGTSVFSLDSIQDRSISEAA